MENAVMVKAVENSYFFSSSSKNSAKLYSNHQTIALISHTIKIMLKMFYSRFANVCNENYQVYNLKSDEAGSHY